jgi:hypothetical protein
MAIFAGMVVLFLHRSTAEEEPRDKLFQYFPPCVGCALANYVGNEGMHMIAGIIILAVIIYILHVLKPFDMTPKA